MDLDLVAKTIAQGTTRRQALRRLGGSLAGGALAGLGLRATTVRAQAQAECPLCRRCIDEFYPACISSCAETFHEAGCATACCEGLLTTCSILGICTADCTVTCPLST